MDDGLAPDANGNAEGGLTITVNLRLKCIKLMLKLRCLGQSSGILMMLLLNIIMRGFNNYPNESLKIKTKLT